jgi:CspA family cold shock protein
MSTIERFMGRVKWFNNKAGYGFITVIDGPKAASDIFVHHSSVQIATEQYKYLTQGEYVEFSLSSVVSGTHDTQAAEVTGIKGGMLMCETRNAAQDYSQSQQQGQQVQVPAKTKYQKKTPVTEFADPAPTGAAWTPASKRPSSAGRGAGGRGAGRGAGGRGGRGAGK